MTSDNDDPAAITPAKRPRPSEERTSPGSQNSTEERTPLGNLTATSAASSNEEFHLHASARITASTPTPPSITIESAYERPPNESNALKTLKGTRLEPHSCPACAAARTFYHQDRRPIKGDAGPLPKNKTTRSQCLPV